MEERPDRTLDLRGTPCPMNWVKAKLALEEMEEGSLLEIILDDGDPIRNVPRSVRAEGHQILVVRPLGEGFSLLVRKVGE